MLSDKQEITMLSSWLLKKNLDDIKYFDTQIFCRKSLFEAIRDGNSYAQLKSLNKLADVDIATITNNGNDSLAYLDARTEALLEMRDLCLERSKQGHASKWTNKALEIQSLIDGKVTAPNECDLAERYIEEFKAIVTEDNPRYGRGFKYLDKNTSGIHKGQLTTIAARPSVGKSALALQVAYNVAQQGYKVIYAPLEMSTFDMLTRLMLYCQAIEPREIKQPTSETFAQIERFLNGIEEENKLIFCTALNNMAAIKQKVKEEKPYIVIIDQLSLLYPDEVYATNRERFMANTRELKRLALDENVAILLMSQINRTSTDQLEPTIENLSESDSIGQDSDNVFMLYATDINKELAAGEYRQVFLKIAKQRNGVRGKNIPLLYDGERFTFSTVEV